MPERKVERIAKYNLSGAVEDTFASKTAQNPATSRRVFGLVPTAAGYIERAFPTAQFASNVLPSGVVWLFEFDQSVGSNIVRYFFAATTNSLFQLNGPPGIGLASWVAVNAVGALNNVPTAVVINNLMHFSDGVNSFIFDGTNWVAEGLPIPQEAPSIALTAANAGIVIASIVRTNNVVTVVISGSNAGLSGQIIISIAGVTDASFNGTFVSQVLSPSSFSYSQVGPDGSSSGGTFSEVPLTINSNRFYWTTFSDQSATHPHESSSSPKSLGTGPTTTQVAQIYQQTGTVSFSIGNTTITGVGTIFDNSMVGKILRIYALNGGSVLFSSTIVSVTDSKHLVVAVAPSSNSGALHYSILPVRATHWNIYCSESENSNVGFFLASVPVNLAGYRDNCPFTNVANSFINTTLQRPIRNDPTTGTKIMSVHKRRIFRRDESFPNFFDYTAFEEVRSTGTGTAEECVPGHDPNTISDIVNEQSYPEQSRIITAMVDHADALFIGTERSVIPLFGESIDDFVLSQITAFSVGIAGRFAVKSTPHGLCFLSYDRKVYLWPQQWIPFYAPEETTTLIELSRPKRTTFQNMNINAVDQTWTEFFNFGKRNWMVVAFNDSNLIWHTYVFDFEIKGWFELPTGVQSLAVFEPTTGAKILVGGGTNGNVYVLDDPTGFFGISTGFSQGIYRPALIDYGEPDMKHINRYVEFEVSNEAMVNDITVNYYLDPIDVDNPGTPIKIPMSKVFGSNRWRGFFTNNAAMCERILLEFIIAPSQNAGNLFSITLAATPASKLAR